MEHAPQERLIFANRGQLRDHTAVELCASCGAKLFSRSYFNQLHSGSTGLSIGANGGNCSTLSRSAK